MQSAVGWCFAKVAKVDANAKCNGWVICKGCRSRRRCKVQWVGDLQRLQKWKKMQSAMGWWSAKVVKVDANAKCNGLVLCEGGQSGCKCEVQWVGALQRLQKWKKMQSATGGCFAKGAKGQNACTLCPPCRCCKAAEPHLEEASAVQTAAGVGGHTFIPIEQLSCWTRTALKAVGAAVGDGGEAGAALGAEGAAELGVGAYGAG